MPKALPDSYDPKKIYQDLMNRCREAKAWNIRCIVDESWIGPAPFDIMIIDGVYHCRVIATTRRDAFLEVTDKLPVIKFIDDVNGEE